MADHDFDTESSETVYAGKILALRVDDVRMPGDAVARREVVEHFGAVAVVALDENDRVAMVYQYRHPVGRRLWELPAGLLDVGGEAPVLTAARELHEEAGLAAENWSVLVDLVTSPGFADESVRVFLATGLSLIDRPAAEHEEADLKLDWLPLAEAVRRVLSGEIVNSIAVAGILAAHAATDRSALRSADSPWIDKPHAFAARQG
ncbi:NUDIX domain-containing protein [Mycolicibacterium diernhoferi]|uniref:ADP-ribose pyrophosphatase n=1 Tax=Mycolicibacterium diernhoferi TaxID=1801 RepID=A0A1Q4H981_9MYCO|nr:NUDIX hydrolase [Mycolicibacterium diernhoferi]OJZ64063.1 ADP-ribose pyrophosphatase [Mycolicibacterium diernhoferi]OPE46425.1 ADP-ribose pyrophosphatase [Mycolicibacterium diernhoferi]PEG55547.1 NUDIX hydrolase [Mycolicibacterium diernhoferi]QYL20756.1 NUDIX hydrolase [Mycolicibacterium diernhoferi]